MLVYFLRKILLNGKHIQVTLLNILLKINSPNFFKQLHAVETIIFLLTHEEVEIEGYYLP